jgi:hypothetical protein
MDLIGTHARTAIDHYNSRDRSTVFTSEKSDCLRCVIDKDFKIVLA